MSLTFYEKPDQLNVESLPDSVIHILCTGGNYSLQQNSVRYNLSRRTYTILTNPILVSGISQSDDFDGYVMSFPYSFVTSIGLRSDFGIIGQMTLLINPVLQLNNNDTERCVELLSILRRRAGISDHRFGEDMIGYLLSAHILDIYDIHSRAVGKFDVGSRSAALLRRFIMMLNDGEYIRERSATHYASKLCVTPHYLSEICRNVSGKPASYWIDRFLTNEIARRLGDKNTPLSDIAASLNFSSLSYFSRYVLNHLGVTPTQYRNRQSSAIK